MTTYDEMSREDLINKAYKNLAHAVIEQAVRDYQKALINNDKGHILENEHFFKSELFRVYSNLNGELLMDRVKKTTLEFISKSHEQFDNGYISPKVKHRHVEGGEAFECPICGGKVFIDFKKLFTITKQPTKEEKEKGIKPTRIGERRGFIARCDSCFVMKYRITDIIYYDNCDESKHNN